MIAINLINLVVGHMASRFKCLNRRYSIFRTNICKYATGNHEYLCKYASYNNIVGMKQTLSECET